MDTNQLREVVSEETGIAANTLVVRQSPSKARWLVTTEEHGLVALVAEARFAGAQHAVWVRELGFGESAVDFRNRASSEGF